MLRDPSPEGVGRATGQLLKMTPADRRASLDALRHVCEEDAWMILTAAFETLADLVAEGQFVPALQRTIASRRRN